MFKKYEVGKIFQLNNGDLVKIEKAFTFSKTTKEGGIVEYLTGDKKGQKAKITLPSKVRNYVEVKQDTYVSYSDNGITRVIHNEVLGTAKCYKKDINSHLFGFELALERAKNRVKKRKEESELLNLKQSIKNLSKNLNFATKEMEESQENLHILLTTMQNLDIFEKISIVFKNIEDYESGDIYASLEDIKYLLKQYNN